jgi:hypothetical protein
MYRTSILVVLTIVFLLTGMSQAVLVGYETNMGWTKDNAGVLVLSPINGFGPDVTVTFTCNRGYNVVDGTWTGLGYHHNSGSGDPVSTLTFSHNVEKVRLTIGDLDKLERLSSMVPIPDDVYDENGYLYISGNSVRTSADNVTGDLIYNEILSTDILSFKFEQVLSNLALFDLKFSVVPEPTTVLILGLGGLSLLRRNKKK